MRLLRYPACWRLSEDSISTISHPPSGCTASTIFRALIFAIEGFLPELLGHQVSLVFGMLTLLNLGPQPQPTKMSAAADKLQLFLTKRAIDDLDGTINRTKALTARFTHEQLQQTFDGLESILKLLLIYTAAMRQSELNVMTLTRST